MLVPKDKNLRVFGAWFGNKFADNSKYIFLKANQRADGKKNIWISKKPEIVSFVQEQGYEAFYAYSLKGIYYQLRAQYVYQSTGIHDICSRTMGNAEIIELWHGIPLKKIMYDAFPAKTQFRKYAYRKKRVIATSSKVASIYSNAFKLPKENILVFGQPRNDIFFDESLVDREMLSKIYEISKKNKIILYAPTHRKEGEVMLNLNSHLDFAWLNNFCAKNNYCFLIKKHYFHANEDEINFSKLSNIFDITNLDLDIQQLLRVTDVLITDYSSIYIDFLLLDRPILFYNYDFTDYVIDDRKLYFNYDEVTPGKKVKNFEEMKNQLVRISMLNTDGYEKQRNVVKNIFFDSTAQKASCDNIIDSLES